MRLLSYSQSGVKRGVHHYSTLTTFEEQALGGGDKLDTAMS